MPNNLAVTDHISTIIVFLEGLLSFLSPCVIPIIPIYMGYLAGNAKIENEDGTYTYKRSKVFLQTLFFVLGISAAFFILGMGISALGSFFHSKQLLFTRIGGILIILMGLYQIGFLEIKFFQRERRFQFRPKGSSMNPIAAFFMGFTFSFAWTPCIGPALSSVLILASSAKSRLIGNLLVLVYAAGFIIPFLLLGLFTTQVLQFLKKNQRLVKYTVKIGGILLIIIGIMTFTGWMNNISKYLNSFSGNNSTQTNDSGRPSEKDSGGENDPAPTTGPADNEEDNEGSEASSDNKNDKIKAFDFTLVDQYGNEHTLSSYEGKVVFLNFWATWCPPCQKEMPDIEELYKEYGLNEEDVIFLGVANPATEDYKNSADVSPEEVTEFLELNGYTFPTVFDIDGKVFQQYMIQAFPTTFLIDTEGYVFGYASGMLTKDIMKSAIKQTMESTK